MPVAFRKLLPSWLFSWIRFLGLIFVGVQDAVRYGRHSSMFYGKSKSALTSRIALQYHSIEKGLALNMPRVGFGERVIRPLTDNIRLYCKQFGNDRVTDVAIGCLEAYCKFNETIGGTEAPAYLIASSCVAEYRTSFLQCEPAGVETVKLEDHRRALQFNPEQFFNSRHSIRDFADRPVALTEIERAVALAQTSPSVCNRQSARVHLVMDQETIEKCLAVQGGARGFAGVQALLVCTSDMRRMVSSAERHQCWVDGGMYAMSLVYAFHSTGLGSCCLNWCKHKSHDIALRQIVPVPDNETIIMLMAVGHLREEFRVACSPKLHVVDVLSLH